MPVTTINKIISLILNGIFALLVVLALYTSEVVAYLGSERWSTVATIVAVLAWARVGGWSDCKGTPGRPWQGTGRDPRVGVGHDDLGVAGNVQHIAQTDDWRARSWLLSRSVTTRDDFREADRQQVTPPVAIQLNIDRGSRYQPRVCFDQVPAGKRRRSVTSKGIPR